MGTEDGGEGTMNL